MKKASVSIVSTVCNEEATIVQFLESIFSQSLSPDEIILVDGGSNDSTVNMIREYKSKIRLFTRGGNRSVGRNFGISRATGSIILLSDAGCILDKEWVKNLVSCFSSPKTKVVAGYYKAKTKTIFQKCLTPYVLIMQDRVDPSTFLPSTRSMGMRKSVWKKVGGFPERFSHNEDYVFAKKLQKEQVPILFCKKAKVYWLPRKNVKEAFIMFFRFAFGDAEAKILRPKVVLVFVRYAIALLLFFLLIISRNKDIFLAFFALITFYLLWSVWKNFRYVRKTHAFFILPVIQLTADAAILLGTTAGLLGLLRSR